VIHFYSGFSEFGGSTLIINSVVRLLNEASVEARFWGPDPWFEKLSPYNHKGFPPLAPDDVLVCHMHAPITRPNVRKNIYYCHEETAEFRKAKFFCESCCIETVGRFHAHSVDSGVCRVCRKRVAKYLGPLQFDHIVFSSVNHEKKSRSVQPRWGPSSIIPNPIEINFEWKPPEIPTAGVIGRLERRKQAAVSIRKAQEAGFERVLLFGNEAGDGYFQEEIEPLLDANVQWMGLVDDREAMYRSVSEVFHYSSKEQAAMVLGECKKLGIPFHCSEAVHDWDLYSDEYIVRAWLELLEV